MTSQANPAASESILTREGRADAVACALVDLQDFPAPVSEFELMFHVGDGHDSDPSPELVRAYARLDRLSHDSKYGTKLQRNYATKMMAGALDDIARLDG